MNTSLKCVCVSVNDVKLMEIYIRQYDVRIATAVSLICISIKFGLWLFFLFTQRGLATERLFYRSSCAEKVSSLLEQHFLNVWWGCHLWYPLAFSCHSRLVNKIKTWGKQVITINLISHKTLQLISLSCLTDWYVGSIIIGAPAKKWCCIPFPGFMVSSSLVLLMQINRDMHNLLKDKLQVT